MRFLYTLIILYATFSGVLRAQSLESAVCDVMQQEGVRFSDNNSLVLLRSGQEKFDDMFAAIRKARHSVHLEYFNFRNDSIAGLLFDVLAEKAKEGVKVRALYDAFGNFSNNRPLKSRHIKKIRDRGIEIFEFDPLSFPWINHVWSRDHRKIVVIDGRVAYTGGMNVADYYLKGTEQVGEWRDMHCRVEGDIVNELQAIFLKTWNRIAEQNVWGAEYYHGGEDAAYITAGLKPDSSATAGCKKIGVANREPHLSPKIMRAFFNACIDNAKDSIRIISPYFTLVGSLKRSLYNALERGVKVEIMLSSRCDEPLTPDVNYYNAHKLMKRGAVIWIFEGGFHHTKIIMADGKVCTVGSTNLDARSLKYDYEENLVILDRETTKELDEMFDYDKHHRSWRLTEEKWNEWRTGWQKFRGWVGHLIGFLL
ncbi:MAG: cardiolipin synthase [Bacteroidaceae bacterium]|nr:cardiolipin synthase [Bacteroidaceae bacterium]